MVPVYNSESSLRELKERVTCVFEDVVGEPFEMILVDDGSKDRSFEIVKELHEEDDRVKGIQLAANHGQQKAVMCGFEYVTGDYVITLDDDLQHPPEEIPVLIEAMAENPDIDVVIGAYDTKKHGIIRKLGSALMNWSSNVIYKKDKSIHMTSFRLMKRFVVDNLTNVWVSVPTVGPLLLQTNQRIANVTVHHDERAYGKSGYSFQKLVTAFMGNFINNSDLLIRAILFVGLFGTVLSMVLGIFYTVRYFIAGSPVQGWTATMVMMLFMSGLVLLSISILGLYVSNLMKEAKKMPKYVIRETKL